MSVCTTHPTKASQTIDVHYWKELQELIDQGHKLRILDIKFIEGIPCMLLLDETTGKQYFFWNYDHYYDVYGH